jgi:hypothetical protein
MSRALPNVCSNTPPSDFQTNIQLFFPALTYPHRNPNTEKGRKKKYWFVWFFWTSNDQILSVIQSYIRACWKNKPIYMPRIIAGHLTHPDTTKSYRRKDDAQNRGKRLKPSLTRERIIGVEIWVGSYNKRQLPFGRKCGEKHPENMC